MTTMPVENDLPFLLRRAEQEAITAIVTDNTAGGPAHYELSRHYSALVVRALLENEAQIAEA